MASGNKNVGIGTEHSGYAKADEGPFMCSRCVHFEPEMKSCDHPDVLEDAEAGDLPVQKGKPIVEAGGCCDYFRPEDQKKTLGMRLINLR